MELYNHQKEILNLNPDKCLLAWECGTGKSIASIALSKVKPSMNVLVVCPKAVKRKWGSEIQKFGDSNKNYLVLTKEEFRRDFQKIGNYQTIIIDECHYFASMTSRMSKSLLAYVKQYKTQNIYLLTATPYMSTPWNIYVLAKILGKEWGYLTFRNKFFYNVSMGGRVVSMVRSGIEEDIAKLVAKIGHVVKLSDCIDIPPQIFKEEYFELTRPQKLEITSQQKTEYNPVVLYTRLHQIINGSLKGDGYTENRTFTNEKADRILEYVMTNSKVAVVCRYNLQIELLARQIQDKTNKTLFIINGETKDKESIVKSVEECDDCVVLINASCSEGYELPSINLILFASLSFSYKDYAQICGRFLRINRPAKNVYVHMIVKDSIDEEVFKCIWKKEDFNIEIYAQKNII